MSADEKFKYAYAFTLLIITVLWGAFSVWIVYKAATELLAVEILGAAGATGLLGAMITWDALVVQHYFRRAKPE
jgi:hypothetical protein